MLLVVGPGAVVEPGVRLAGTAGVVPEPLTGTLMKWLNQFGDTVRLRQRNIQLPVGSKPELDSVTVIVPSAFKLSTKATWPSGKPEFASSSAIEWTDGVVLTHPLGAAVAHVSAFPVK